MNKDLHIVCLDAPAPADYGGAMDMLWKIKALSAAGVRIHLHYFSYKRSPDEEELKKYCTTINAYKRKTGLAGISFRLPYIVSSRINKELVAHINADDHPVLLEGIHCSGILQFINKDKKILVRLHNDEASYYGALARSEHGFFRKIYFRRESRLLAKYQQHLPGNINYGCIAESEMKVFKNNYHLSNIFYLPAFTSFREIHCKSGKGDYCLYHGNLSVSENDKVARWLVENVFGAMGIQLVIAGKDPSGLLKRLISTKKQISLVEDPPEEKMEELIQHAQINVLPSLSSTGIKLKLLHALFSGRHCLVNEEMLASTGILRPACYVANTPEEFRSLVTQLMPVQFTETDIEKRKKILEENFDNNKNAQLIIQCLW